MSAAWVAAFIALCAIVALLALIVLGTLRRLAPLIERAEANLAAVAERAAPGALPTGATVPPFAAEATDGATFTELELRNTRMVVLFLGSRCSACEHLVESLENGGAPHLSSRLLAVTESPEEAQRLAHSAHVTVIADEQRSVAKAFESDTVPHAFVVDDGVVVASGRPNHWDGLEDLVRNAKGGDHQPEVAAEAVTSQ